MEDHHFLIAQHTPIACPTMSSPGGGSDSSGLTPPPDDSPASAPTPKSRTPTPTRDMDIDMDAPAPPRLVPAPVESAPEPVASAPKVKLKIKLNAHAPSPAEKKDQGGKRRRGAAAAHDEPHDAVASHEHEHEQDHGEAEGSTKKRRAPRRSRGDANANADAESAPAPVHAESSTTASVEKKPARGRKAAPKRKAVVSSPEPDYKPESGDAESPSSQTLPVSSQRSDKGKTPAQSHEDKDGKGPKTTTPGTGARVPKVPKRPAGAAGAPPHRASPAGTPSRAAPAAAVGPRPSLLASTLSKLSVKTDKKPASAAAAGTGSSANEPDLHRERPRAGAWADEFVLTPEQDAQYAAASIQRSYASAERVKMVTPAMRIQEPKDAYKADFLVSGEKEESERVRRRHRTRRAAS